MHSVVYLRQLFIDVGYKRRGIDIGKVALGRALGALHLILHVDALTGEQRGKIPLYSARLYLFELQNGGELVDEGIE